MYRQKSREERERERERERGQKQSQSISHPTHNLQSGRRLYRIELHLTLRFISGATLHGCERERVDYNKTLVTDPRLSSNPETFDEWRRISTNCDGGRTFRNDTRPGSKTDVTN